MGLGRKVKQAVLEHAPAQMVIRELVRRELAGGEPELRRVGQLLDRGRLFVDVGANRGIYSYVARRQGSQVVAIEANPDLADFVRRWSKGTVHVLDVALSDRVGPGTLRTPIGDFGAQDGLSSLELDDSVYGEVQARQVLLARLDDLELHDCGFVKVDVEGHELAVLRGGMETLARDRPLIQVEVEERHHPGSLIDFSELADSIGYRGFYVHHGMRPVSEFDPVALQPRTAVNWGDRRPAATYVNNFYFAADEGQIERIRRVVSS